MNRARIGKIALVLAVAAGPMVYGVTQIGHTGSALERTLWDIGFYSVRPPSTLVAPGSIYHVSSDGRFYTLVCKADAQDVAAVLERSPSEEMVARELQKMTYSLDAEPTRQINAALDGNIVELVNYSLRDVTVLEIPLDKNAEIFAKLTQHELCRNQVDDLLENGELVCQGQSVLQATVEYQLATKSAADGSAKLAPENISAVKAALEAAVSTSVAFDQGRFVSGTALHYGVKVNPMCATRATDRVARHLPRNAFERLASFVHLTLLGA